MNTQRLTKIARSLMVILSALAFSYQVHAAAPEEQVVADIQAILIGGEARTEAASVAELRIRRADTGKVEVGKVGTRLVFGDEIKTGADVEVSLIFTRPNTEDRIEVFMLQNSHAAVSSLFSFYGSFIVSGWGIFDTKTRYVRLGKRGTEFQIDVDDKKETVDLTVLRGLVEVDQREFSPPTPQPILEDQFINSAYVMPAPSRAQRTAIVTGMQKVRIEKNAPIPAPVDLKDVEVVGYVARTNYLYLATMPARTPSNIRPTITIGEKDNPRDNKAHALETLTKAREAAILKPDATNTRKLGEVYKDFGAGPRSAIELNKAETLDPALRRDTSFLISQAEAYRLSGNLEKSENRLRAARTTPGATANPDTDRAIKIASGNLNYDQALVAIARDDRPAATTHLRDSRRAYEAAVRTGRPDPIVSRNLNNVKLAINKSDPTATRSSGLDGTYRGTLDFPAARLSGEATLVITGSRFSLIHCKGTFKGSIVPGTKTADGTTPYDFLFETHGPVPKLTLKFDGTVTARIVTNAPGETHKFNFTQHQTTTPGMKCVEKNRIANQVIWRN